MQKPYSFCLVKYILIKLIHIMETKQLIIGTLLGLTINSQAAVITWSTEQSTTDAGAATVAYSVLDTVVERAQFGNAATQVGWTDGDLGTTNSNLSTLLVSSASGNGGTWTASTADLGVIATSHSWSNGNNVGTITLSGLTNGNQYKVQFFMNDNRAGIPTRTMDYSTGASSISTTRGDGQSVIGTFIADATTQNISFDGTNGVNEPDLALNGYILSTSVVPEPSSLAFLGLGGLALFAHRRRK